MKIELVDILPAIVEQNVVLTLTPEEAGQLFAVVDKASDGENFSGDTVNKGYAYDFWVLLHDQGIDRGGLS